MKINSKKQKFFYHFFFAIIFFSTACNNFTSPIKKLEEKRLRSAIRIHPKHELGYVRLAQYFERLNRYSEAFSILRKGQSQIPNSIALIRLEGEIFQALGNYKKALIFYSKQILNHPDDPTLYFDRARIHWNMGEKNLALVDTQKALKLSPNFFEALYLAGVILSYDTEKISEEQSDQALEYFIRASQINDKNPDLWLRISTLWESRNNINMAKIAMRKTLDLSPESKLYLRRFVVLQEKELDEANQENSFQIAQSLQKTLLHMLELFPQNAWVHAHYGNWAWTQDNFPLAEKHLIHAKKLKQIYPWASFRLGVVYQTQKKWHLALSSFKEGLKYEPKNSWAIQQIGLTFEKLGKNSEAIEQYEWLMLNTSAKVIVINRLTSLYWDELLFKKGEDTLIRGLEKLPLEITLIERLVNYYESHSQFKKASNVLNSFLKVVPNNSTALAKIGFYEKKLNQFDKALEFFNKALSISPDFEWARIQQIGILLKTNRIKSAEKKLKSFLKFSQNNEWALSELSKIKIKQGKFSVAEDILNKSIKQHKKSLVLLQTQALMFKLQKRWIEAERVFKKLDNLRPNNSIFLTNLAFIQWRLNKTKEARENIKNALYEDPRNILAWNINFLLESEFEQKRWMGKDLYSLLPILKILATKTSDETWEKIKSVRTDPFSLQVLKNLFYLLEGYPDKILLEPKDMTSKKLSPWIHEKWGVFHEILGNGELAALHFEMVLKALPNYSWIHARLGLIYEKLEKLEKSRYHYKAFLKEHPKSFEVNFRLANINILLGYEESSIKLYQKLISEHPENDLVLNNLAWLFLTAQDRKLRNTKKGLELALKSVDIFPTIDNLDTLAEAYFQSGKIKKAIQTIRKAALEIKYPSNRHPYLRKQLLRFRKGEINTSPPEIS